MGGETQPLGCLGALQPALRHVAPDRLVAGIMGEFGHEFAFSGEPIEFFRGIHRLASLRGPGRSR